MSGFVIIYSYTLITIHLMKISKFILAALLVGIGMCAQAQQIGGTVFEMRAGKKITLPGANIYWEGTQTGTSTDGDGAFILKRLSGHDQLVIRFIGFEPTIITVQKDKDFYEIELNEMRVLETVTIAAVAPGTHISRVNPIYTQNITGEELCKAACCNLAESFETNPSVDVNYGDAVTGAKQIQLLGLSGTYVQLMTENYPNFHGLAQAYGLGYIPGSWMEAIQVSKGNSSVVNGYEALTGQINVEYKKPKASEIVYVNGLVNSAGKMEANANASHILNEKWSTMVMAHIEDLSQENDHNDDGFLDSPYLQQQNYMNRWDYKNGATTARIGFKYLKENREGGQVDFDPEAPTFAARGFGIDIETERFEGFAKIGHTFKDKNESSFGFINSFSSHEQNSFYGQNQYDGKQLSFYSNFIFSSQMGSENHKYATGVSFKYDDFVETLNDKQMNTTEIVPGAFFQYTYNNQNNLVVLAGIRADHHSDFGAFVTPRIHAKYDITENTKLRGSIGKGCRSAHAIADNSYLLASAKTIVLEDELKMEEAINMGLSLTQYFSLFGRELTLSGEVYRTSFQNQVIVDMDSDMSMIQFYNLDGESYSNNYQLETKYELLAGWSATAAIRYSDVKMTINDELREKPLINRYKGLFTTSYTTPLKKWQFDFTSQFNGGGRIPSTEGSPVAYQRAEKFDPYTIINAQITKYFRKWDIYLGVENLTDFTQSNPIIAADDPSSTYFDATKIWGPIHGRKFYLGFRYSIERD